MTHIRVECSGCRSILQVRSDLAGGQGRCPKCGATIAIPAAAADESDAVAAAMSTVIGLGKANAAAAAAAAAAMPLTQAMAPDMLAELARRGKSAVLVVFETPADGGYALPEQPDANVRCYHTPDMNDSQLMQVLAGVGRLSRGERNPKGGMSLASGAAAPFEHKGDRLGMTLAEFKTKHARTIGGVKLPYTSESSAGQGNATLWSEPWHAAAGIVHARIELPSENNSPTIAGVKSELFLFQFVDGRLYRMMGLFDTEAFHVVRAALAQKYGAPKSEVKDPMEMAWDNGVSEVRLVRGTMRPKKASLVLYVHHALQKLADSRIPRRGDDL